MWTPYLGDRKETLYYHKIMCNVYRQLSYQWEMKSINYKWMTTNTIANRYNKSWGYINQAQLNKVSYDNLL